MITIDEIIESARQKGGIKRQIIRLDNFQTGVDYFEKIANARLEAKGQEFVHCTEVEKLVDWVYCTKKFDTDYNKGVLIKGTTGKGKTFLMDCFTDFCRIDEPFYITNGEQRSIVPIKVNARELASKYASDGHLYPYTEYQSLFIDDIGAESTSSMFYGNKVSVITELLDEREAKNLLTFGTTNIEKLKDVYDDRTISRISAMFNIWYIENKNDYRLNPNKIIKQ